MVHINIANRKRQKNKRSNTSANIFQSLEKSCVSLLEEWCCGFILAMTSESVAPLCISLVAVLSVVPASCTVKLAGTCWSETSTSWHETRSRDLCTYDVFKRRMQSMRARYRKTIFSTQGGMGLSETWCRFNTITVTTIDSVVMAIVQVRYIPEKMRKRRTWANEIPNLDDIVKRCKFHRINLFHCEASPCFLLICRNTTWRQTNFPFAHKWRNSFTRNPQIFRHFTVFPQLYTFS